VPIKNEVMLITYPDSLGRNLAELREILTRYCDGVVGSVHILPFYPSTADRGFAPTTYDDVDPVFGSWQEINALADRFDLMFDFMINHISRRSQYYSDFVMHKDGSPFRDLFIRYGQFWLNGQPSQEQLDLIYKRKPRAPFIEQTFGDGSTEKIWCTFDEEQIDLNCRTEATRDFIAQNLQQLARRGASIIRLDAFAYATKRPSTNCFFVEPDVWDLLEHAQSALQPLGVEILPEIHEHYTLQMKLAARGYWVYDFALPMLVLHALYTGSSRRLAHWLRICPRKQFTTLDTHDGIGVVDVKDLLSDDEIEQTRQHIYARGANVKRIYSTAAYRNLDVYQLNCTFYSALGNDDQAYLLARAIQFFTPGVPQVYYVGLLAGTNDLELVERTKVGRDINRHCYSREAVVRNLERPVVQWLFALMRFRNSFPAFDGECTVLEVSADEALQVDWHNAGYTATLRANLTTRKFAITYSEGRSGKTHEWHGVP
jgi:sucrose phosphorylase